VSALEWVAEAAGARPGRVTLLPGTSFHRNEAIELQGAEPVVLRRWAGAGWERTDAEFDARREAAVLELLADTPVPAPRLLAADPDGECCGVPALLVSLLPGRPPGDDLDPMVVVDGMARLADAIHAVDAAGRVPPYRRYVAPERLARPAWSRRPELWQRAVEVARGAAPPLPDCLIHRDFHPGNTLWEGERLTGVVDWSYASWGAAAVDAASLRWNLAVDHGPGTAARVPGAHPYWDVVTVLDVACEDPADDGGIGEALERHLEDVLG
jgi:aminoglycoside phosphotransferase (APT) family kinase protein